MTLTIEPITVPGVANAYLVSGELRCRVELSRPVGAAAHMYGCLAVATAIDETGADVPGTPGRHTEAVPKSELLVDPAGVAAAVTARATTAAITAWVTERAVTAANAAAGI